MLKSNAFDGFKPAIVDVRQHFKPLVVVQLQQCAIEDAARPRHTTTDTGCASYTLRTRAEPKYSVHQLRTRMFSDNFLAIFLGRILIRVPLLQDPVVSVTSSSINKRLVLLPSRASLFLQARVD